MDLLIQTKYLIKQTGLKPDKFKGQNFCVDEDVIKNMVQTAAVSQSDTILEVGPGFGFLTQELVKYAKHVIAVELDATLAAFLKKLEAIHQNLTVVTKDILQVPSSKIQDTNKSQTPNLRFQTQMADSDTRYTIYDTRYKIVANLPYGITSAFLRKFLTAENQPKSITLLLQKEVAERIYASPTNMSLLAISVQLYGQPQIIKIIAKDSFWPKPKVDSAIIKISNIHRFPYSEITEKFFWQTVRSGFSAKRKQLKNNLANSFHLSPQDVQKILVKTKLNPLARAQELSLMDWQRLCIQLMEVVK